MLAITPLYTDGALIQRNAPVHVWGTALAGAQVSARLNADTADGHSTVEQVVCNADEYGRWEAVFPSQPAGATATMVVSSRDERIEVSDLLFGDVWLLAGQSNMELWLARLVSKYPHVLEEVHDDAIRVFEMKQIFDFEHEHDDLDEGHWIKASTDDFSNVSGVGYFFAQRIRNDVHVPIGLVSTAIGGTRVESWMSRASMESIGMLPDDFDRLTAQYVNRVERLAAQSDERYWQAFDDADVGLHEHWEEPGFDDGSWKTMMLTESQRPELLSSGSIWLRKVINVPETLVGKPAQLRLGTLTDADDCYLDGVLIGATGYQYPPRNYDIASLPKQFTIAWRIKVINGHGGLTEYKSHTIVVDPGGPWEQVVDMDAQGPWRFKRASYMPNIPVAESFIRECAVGDYNAMIAPLRRLHLAGVLWYQGESNCWHTQGYAMKQMTMVQSWRELFGQSDLPFIYAQLPNYQLDDPSSWVRMRDQQRQALAISHTAMVTTYDVGEDNDLHPLDKRTVGVRMAVAAEALAYGFDHEPMGPIPSVVTVHAGHMDIRFCHVGTGLRERGPLKFTLIGGGVGLPDRLELRGEIIADNRIRVTLPFGSVPDVHARLCFACEASPQVTLTNDQGLLATPFDMPLS